MSLNEYIRKRNFKQTAEPNTAKLNRTQNRFANQKHAASRLHYDFRLEIDGVLKTWALPKGVSFVKGEKRLAVEVEDHPVCYINFEGTTPKGQYGGGTVMVWDKGTFLAEVKSPAKELERGKLHFKLDGEKLQGEWYLVRLRDDKLWLLIKGDKDFKPVSKKIDDTSALSGKTMLQISNNGLVWKSKPRAEKSSFESKLRAKVSSLKAAKKNLLPVKFIEPMKARLVGSPPPGADWIYKIKFDGFRALAFTNGRQVRLLSRNETDFAEKFPAIVEAIADLEIDEAIIDSEIVDVLQRVKKRRFICASPKIKTKIAEITFIGLKYTRRII